MAYNFGYNQNPYYTGYNPQIQQPQPQQTAPTTTTGGETV